LIKLFFTVKHHILFGLNVLKMFDDKTYFV